MANDTLTPLARSERATNPVAFFAGFLRNPQEVGSVIPSSRYLEQRIIDAAELGRARCVVELGPGTGGTTRAILAALPAEARLLAIDTSAQFVELLGEIDDPRLIPQQGSAEQLQALLALHGLPAPDVVISGIPFSTMPRSVGRAIAGAIAETLPAGGRFVAYQFRGDVAAITRPLLGRPDCEVEWRNLPPMRVYTWRQRAAPTRH